MTLPLMASNETQYKESRAIYCPSEVHPVRMLWAVSGWELRRVAASRSAWIGACAAFSFFLLITLLLSGRALALTYSNTLPPSSANMVNVYGLSAWGMLIILPRYPLLIMGLFLPFIAGEGVARDFHRRTADMLMATRVPGWAYVAGRFAAMLALGLGLALLMLAAIAGGGLGLHIWSAYPAPNLLAILALWAVAVLPAAVLVSGMGFTLGTLLPRYSNAAKAAVVIFWVLSQFAAALWENTASPYTVIDPAGMVMSQVVQGPYGEAYHTRISSLAQSGEEQSQPVTREKAQEVLTVVEQTMPDLWPWIPPRAGYIVVGLGLGAFAAARFRRFRNT
ncbi:MAG: hypothetical protein IVW55_13585 [Chloroflexi bacterium]|nr:hypothetical protein [Chloroflexota bacterium]